MSLYNKMSYNQTLSSFAVAMVIVAMTTVVMTTVNILLLLWRLLLWRLLLWRLIYCRSENLALQAIFNHMKKIRNTRYPVVSWAGAQSSHSHILGYLVYLLYRFSERCLVLPSCCRVTNSNWSRI